MKKLLGILLILVSIGGVFRGEFLASLVILFIGLILISTQKKEKIKRHNKLSEVRFVKSSERKIPILRNSTKEISKQKFSKYVEGLPNLEISKDIPNGLRYSDYNLPLFESFIANSKKTIDIITHDFSEKILIDLLNYIRDKEIKIRIITYSINEKGYLDYFKNKYPNLSIEICKLKNIHGKLIIRDNEKILLGSANLDNSSLTKNYEVNIILDGNENLKKARGLFDSLWFKKDLNDWDIKSDLLFSKGDNFGLPLYLKHLFEEENKVTIIMNLNAIDKEVLDEIRLWNKNLKIDLITGDFWGNHVVDNDKIKSFQFLKLASNEREENIQVFPKKTYIHAKTYLFEKQGIIFVSSQNLTKDSWRSELEIGFLLEDKKELKNLVKKINELGEGVLSPLTFMNVNKPELKWEGTETKFKILDIPWRLLGEEKPNFLPKKKVWEYFKLVREERKRQSERSEGKAEPVPIEPQKKIFPLSKEMLNYLENEELPKKTRLNLINMSLQRLKKEDREGKISLETSKSENQKLIELKIKTQNESLNKIPKIILEGERKKEKEFLEKIGYKK